MINFTLVRKLATKAWGNHTRDCNVVFYKHTYVFNIPILSEGAELGPLISISHDADKITLSYERIIHPAHPPIPVDLELDDSPVPSRH
jgi:hypothetical protein